MEAKESVGVDVLTQMEAFIKNIRKTSVFRTLVPMEAISGFPIIFRKAGVIYVTVPFYGMEFESVGNFGLYPPFALITATWTKQRIVEYTNLRFKNNWKEGQWDKKVGKFPHEDIAELKKSEYKQKKKEMFKMYDSVIDCVMNGKDISQELGEAFSSTLRLLMPPALEPYYRAISPKFFGRFLPEK